MLSSGAAVRLVAGREISTRIASKAFRITTAVMLLVVVAFLAVMKFAGDDSGSKVGFTASASALSAPLASTANAVGETVTVSTVDEATGVAQLRSGDLDALVTGTPAAFSVTVEKNLSPQLSRVLQVLARQVALNEQVVKVGGDPATVSAAMESATFAVTTLEPETPFRVERLVLGLIAGVLVYLALMLYGQFVAQGVVEEKSSRIVELLLTTIKPWQLMLGKVAGIGLVGLAQLLLLAVVGVGAGLALDVIDFPASIAAAAAAWTVVWFLLGFVVYALMFAASAALVSRQEDVGAVTTPALMLIILPYVLGSTILPSDPDNRLIEVLSLIPVFSPTLMPMRISMGVPVWQVALSLVLTAGLAVVLVWLAGRMYRNAVLRTGSRVSFREALRTPA